MAAPRQHTNRPNVVAWVSSSRGLLLLMVLSAALLAGCSRGTYPIDFFPEMHYNKSFKVQEPPSLSAPSDSVPITGRALDYTLEQARQLQMPGSISRDDSAVARGERLFTTNCAVCHGLNAKGGDGGDGPMWKRLEDAGYRPASPGDLTGTGPTVGKVDGEVFLIITKGFGLAMGFSSGRFVMPTFGKLLTEEERWTLVRYIRSLQ